VITKVTYQGWVTYKVKQSTSLLNEHNNVLTKLFKAQKDVDNILALLQIKLSFIFLMTLYKHRRKYSLQIFVWPLSKLNFFLAMS